MVSPEAILSYEDYGVADAENFVNLQHGNGSAEDNDGYTGGNDGGRMADDSAGDTQSTRDRSDIRVYEEGLGVTSDEYTDDSERNRRAAESERLVGIARENGQYLEKKEVLSHGGRNPKTTGESEVVIDRENGVVYKIKDPYAKSPMKGNVQPEDAIYEHLVHNKYFPETHYTFEGISEDMGDARIVLSQDFIESYSQPTKEQIESALAEKGLYPEGKYRYGNDEISVTDVTGDNALLGADGKVYFIDPIIDFKKPVREILGDSASADNLSQSGSSSDVESQSGYRSGRIKIRNSDGTETRGVLTGYVDENGNHEYYVEGDLRHLHYASEHELNNILSEYVPDEPEPTATVTDQPEAVSEQPEIADKMVEVKRKAYEKLQKQKAKGNTPTEILESKIENAAQLAQAESEYNLWTGIAGVEQAREDAVRAEREAEERRLAAERAETEKAWNEQKQRLDKKLRNTAEIVRDCPEAVEILKDDNPQNIWEAASIVLSTYKLIPRNDGVLQGFREMTGYSSGEQRKLFGLFATAANGGKTLERLAEDAMVSVCTDFGIPYDNSEALKALLDILQSCETLGQIRNYIANNRIQQALEYYEQWKRYNEWSPEDIKSYEDYIFSEEYGMTPAEYEDECRLWEEYMSDHIEEIDRDFDANEFYGNIADEMASRDNTDVIKREDYDNRQRGASQTEPGRDGAHEGDESSGAESISGGGREVLQQPQADNAVGKDSDDGGRAVRPQAGDRGIVSPSAVVAPASGQEELRSDKTVVTQTAEGEHAPSGTEPSERGGRTAGDSRGGGNIVNGGEGEATTHEKRLTKEEASGIIAEMELRATVGPELELTIENWDAEFGENGIVSTPIGDVKMGENQFTKLMRQGRNSKLGMIKPTLEHPDIIIEDASEARDTETTERASSYVFVKTFTKPDGSRYYYFTSVTVSKDGHEVVVSNQEKRRNVLTNLLMKGKLVWKHADNVSPASDVADGLYSPQGNMSDPASEGTDAPQTNNVFSDRKVSNSASDKQEQGAESSLQTSDKKVEGSIQSAVEAASADVNVSPTAAQAEAGNYKKGHVTIGEFEITIENPAGSIRKGVDADGKEWSTTMANAYGYIKGTESVDGDHIDVFLHKDMDEWNGRKVYVVDQTKRDGTFDEHKVMLGFNDKDEAMNAYLANYDKTWGETHPGLRISETNIEDFNKWVQSSHRKTKPFADYSTVSKVVDDAPVKTEPQHPEQPAGTIEGEGYKVVSMPYTNKQGKTLDTYLVTFNRDFSKEELSALRSKVRALRGCYKTVCTPHS